MKRSEIRENIFRLLFRVEFNPKEDMDEQKEFYMKEEQLENASEEEKNYIKEKYQLIVERIPELDEKINLVADRWKTSHMGKTDLTILRLAVFEIQYDEAVPTGVAINEAVELSKKFGQDESPAFINGILAKFAQ